MWHIRGALFFRNIIMYPSVIIHEVGHFISYVFLGIPIIEMRVGYGMTVMFSGRFMGAIITFAHLSTYARTKGAASASFGGWCEWVDLSVIPSWKLRIMFASGSLANLLVATALYGFTTLSYISIWLILTNLYIIKKAKLDLYRFWIGR